MDNVSCRQVQTPCRAMLLDDIHHLLKLMSPAHLSPVIKIPDVEFEGRNPGLDDQDDWVEDQGEEEARQLVPLVKSCLGEDDVVPQNKLSLHTIAGIDPLDNLGKMFFHFTKQL